MGVPPNHPKSTRCNSTSISKSSYKLHLMFPKMGVPPNHPKLDQFGIEPLVFGFPISRHIMTYPIIANESVYSYIFPQYILCVYLEAGCFRLMCPLSLSGFRLDWMLPQAWDVEHNKAHHYYLSEAGNGD